MDEFGSPISGGIRAVRRNISSSFLGAPQSLQSDTITTDLLQEQSLKLTSVSSQLTNVSRQISSLDFSLKSVKENLVLNQQLERQREAAKQKRERILAEQGLREGKESELEKKIQSSLTQPLQRIGQKTQNILGGLTQFLLTLAGGWLTLTGIDLLQAMAEGNVDKINRLKVKFLGGLTILLGSLTAIQIGIKKTVGLIGIFAGNIARVAFGGVLQGSLFGLRLLMAGLVRRAGQLGGLGGVGQTVRSVIDFAIGEALINLLFRGKGKGLKNVLRSQNLSRSVASKVTMNADAAIELGKNKSVFTKTKPILERVVNPVKKSYQKVKEVLVGQPSNMGAMGNPTRTGGLLGRAKGFLNRGKNLIDDGIKAVGSTGILSKAKNLMKGFPKVGVGKLLGKALGPFITFFSELLSEDGGLMSALAATAGFMAGAKVGAIAGGAIGALFGGVGAGPGAFIGALIGGFAGETVMKNLSKKIMNALGMKDIKVFGNKEEDNKEVDGVTANSNNIEAVKNGNLDAANKISEFSEEKTEIIDLSQQNNSNSGQVGGGVDDNPGNTVPDIDFDNNNTHATTSTALTGVGP